MPVRWIESETRKQRDDQKQTDQIPVNNGKATKHN